jgi:hypothetical protein
MRGRVADAGPAEAQALALLVMHDSLIATWRSDGSPTGDVGWASVRPDAGPIASPGPSRTAISGTIEFHAQRLDSATALWVARDGTSQSRIRAALWRDGVFRDLGAVELRADGRVSRLIATGGKRAVFLGAVLPAVATVAALGPLTIVNELELRCTGLGAGRPR